jgi:thioredoxin 1
VCRMRKRRENVVQVKTALVVCTGTFIAMGLFAYLCYRALEAWFSSTMSFQNTHVVSLSNDNFNQFVENAEKDVVVTFYAPWCPFCRALKPELIKFAEQEKRVLCAAVDVTRNELLASRYHIEALPTILWFRKGNTEHFVKMENLTRDMAGLVSWLDKKKRWG